MSSGLHTYRHEAMNTWFEVSIALGEEAYARKAATEAFREIDRLENLLSRFREGSDVDILNKRGGREPVRVTEECWNCLLLAMDVEILSRGIFSIACESFMELEADEARSRVGAWLEMDAGHLTVFFKQPGTHIDLGGIGKGYALDRVAELLREWDLEHFLFNAGTSSVVARGFPPEKDAWTVGVGAGAYAREVPLRNESLSGSSLAVQSSHILDLKSRQVLQSGRRTWAWAETGAVSDALSTCFMLMPLDEIDAICQRYSQLGALIVEPSKENPLVFGTAGKFFSIPNG